MVMHQCLRCKEQREMQNPVEFVSKNGMRMLKGKCPKCGAGMNKILGKAK